MSRGFLGQATHTFCQSTSAGMAESVRLVGGFVQETNKQKAAALAQGTHVPYDHGIKIEPPPKVNTAPPLPLLPVGYSSASAAAAATTQLKPVEINTNFPKFDPPSLPPLPTCEIKPLNLGPLPEPPAFSHYIIPPLYNSASSPPINVIDFTKKPF